MQNWITNTDVNLWKIVLKGNHARRTAQDATGALYYLEPESAEEIAELQREERVRTILLQAIPDDHMADFHNMHDARDIWRSIQARFGGNDESKRMQKSMLK